MHSDLTARLSKYGISETRFNDEKSSLQEAGFSALEAEKLIIRKSSFNTVRTVLACYPVLMDAPHHLTRAQIIRIASHIGGSKNLETVARYHTALMTLGFNSEDLVRMVSHIGGSKNLEAVVTHQAALMELGLNSEQVIRIVSHIGGSKNLEAVARYQAALMELGLNSEQVIRMVSHGGGGKNLEAVVTHQAALMTLGFSSEEIVRMVSHGGGSKNLEVVARYQAALMTLGFNSEQIVRMVSHNGGSKNLEAVARYQAALMALEFNSEDLVRMVSHSGGSKNLEAVLEHSKMLFSSGHSRESILKIVSAAGGGGKLNQKRSFYDAFGGDDFLDDIAIFGDLSEATSSPLDGTPNIEASLPRQMNPIAPSNHEEAVWGDGEDDLIPTLVTLLDEADAAKEADAARGAVLDYSIFSSPSMPGEEGVCTDRTQQPRERNVRMGG
ncbi:MAG: hypothetical protein K0U37_08940 [Gammaproteobacteria bacterium]|nr:hypothetical protein [Gammaproteobacteria bacterium]